MPNDIRKINIQAYKYGGRLHYEWETVLLEQTDTHILVLGEHGRKLNHLTRGQIFTMHNWTLEYFSFVDWFTVSGDIRDGEIYQYYCNINQPAVQKGDVVSFVDLDLDIVLRDGEWKVVDQDEFEAHSVEFGYPKELIDRTRRELLRLQERVECKLYPFDGMLERWVPRIREHFMAE